MTPVRVRRAAAEQVQQEIREATGFANLPVIDVMTRMGDWIVIDDPQPTAAGSVPRGVA